MTLAVSLALLLALATALGPTATPSFAASKPTAKPSKAIPATATPIQHLVVIFQENVSFDHYFGTYPNALNLKGDILFTPAENTPTVNGLSTALLTINGNFLNTTNGTGAANPFRLSRIEASTADQDHDYGPEQMAFHNGKMDLFPLSVGTPNSTALAASTGAPAITATTATTINSPRFRRNP